MSTFVSKCLVSPPNDSARPPGRQGDTVARLRSGTSPENSKLQVMAADERHTSLGIISANEDALKRFESSLTTKLDDFVAKVSFIPGQVHVGVPLRPQSHGCLEERMNDGWLSLPMS